MVIKTVSNLLCFTFTLKTVKQASDYSTWTNITNSASRNLSGMIKVPAKIQNSSLNYDKICCFSATIHSVRKPKMDFLVHFWLWLMESFKLTQSHKNTVSAITWSQQALIKKVQQPDTVRINNINFTLLWRFGEKVKTELTVALKMHINLWGTHLIWFLSTIAGEQWFVNLFKEEKNLSKERNEALSDSIISRMKILLPLLSKQSPSFSLSFSLWCLCRKKKNPECYSFFNLFSVLFLISDTSVLLNDSVHLSLQCLKQFISHTSSKALNQRRSLH